jgi:hypothetical protein
VKALVFEYADAEGKTFDNWDSESSHFANATPERIMVRLEIADGNETYGFQTTVALPAVRRKSG